MTSWPGRFCHLVCVVLRYQKGLVSRENEAFHYFIFVEWFKSGFSNPWIPSLNLDQGVMSRNALLIIRTLDPLLSRRYFYSD